MHPSSRHHAQHHLHPQLIVNNSASTGTNAIPRVQWKQMHCSCPRVGYGNVAGCRLKSTEPSLTASLTGGVGVPQPSIVSTSYGCLSTSRQARKRGRKGHRASQFRGLSKYLRRIRTSGGGGTEKAKPSTSGPWPDPGILEGRLFI